MIYCIDIRWNICSKDNEDYNFAVPYEDRIEIINQLYEEGNKIIFFTARGSATGIDWEDTTKKQLDEWQVKYHELRFW